MYIEDIKLITNEIKLAVNNRINASTSSESPMIGMIDEEIVFGYIDIINNFESFIKSSLTQKTSEFILKLKESAVYSNPDSKSLLRMQRIGSVCKELRVAEYPFPLFRNLDLYTVAFSLFPQGLQLPQAFDEKNLITSIDKILSLD